MSDRIGHFPTPVKDGEDALLPDSRMPVPLADGGVITAEEASAAHDPHRDTPDWLRDAVADDPTDGMSDGEIEVAATPAEMILADNPDPEGFTNLVDGMSASLQGKVFSVLSHYPHLRETALLDQVEKTLNLEEQAEAERWLRNLPAHHKAWLRGGE